ncbi:phosphoribosylpyrophosphate synthetase [Candidatus Desantisbacteria bacterium CG07_land_8_20_14_0_80_39_15]|uniref:Ribose-phosphate pyrophosphokinase n=2 Tax=unclassified Candidatus Desantisiibacteriota TaxID=3106372 RepID=A0A2H9P9L6_9BACT|nr:MAG: phosphoribosylpyrophosphate synthetase [Candidatus Desantisbacteria bacterium CG07_land_8_20_14_0_80_39_15]PIZ14984.1 MAG: phosphoribosylpyrophosphate synthetase [Candidatus Desantisbacteria bacterium CG_4_10_14_0_8_um_filter_39_17]
MSNEMKIFTGNANPELAREICDYLNVPSGNAEVRSFSDGEIFVKINENVRGADTFVIQPTSPPVDRNLMELLIMVDALRRASAERITAVIPYYGYARQDRKVQPRAPITAKLVANLITIAGVNRVLVMDLHAGQIQGFFDIPVDNLFAASVLIDYIQKMKLDNLVFVSPDTGGAERVRAFAKRLNTTMAIIDKRRPRPNVSEVHHVVGNVRDKNAIILDDMIDTGGSIVKAAEVLIKKGAKTVYAVCTHPVFSGSATQHIEKSPLKEVIATNTIPLNNKKSKKIRMLSIAPLLGEAIKRIHQGESVSSLFV